VDSERTRAAIEAFLLQCSRPALLEPGEDYFLLRDGAWELACRNGRLTIQVWDDLRHLARRISGVVETRPGRLELRVERFAKQVGSVYLLDLERAGPSEGRRRGRLIFRERFRAFLTRHFSGWKVAELSTETNLEQSLSPAYPRALLSRGSTGWAAIAAASEAGSAGGALTFGLIWLDYLRSRERRLTIEGLALLLPEREARPVCHLIPFLDAGAARFATYIYGEEGCEDRLEPQDYGNLDTRLEPCAAWVGSLGRENWAGRLGRLPGVETSVRGGSLSFRIHGLEFARLAGSGLRFGVDHKAQARPENFAEIEALARELVRLRSPSAAREHPLWRAQPEAWLESQVRAHIEQIDPSICAEPVYSQVPEAAAGERGRMDLVALSRDGRLAVIELKASEDIQLPVQALDYWLRVKWHLDRKEFTALGYFPGVAIDPRPPRLLLVAPALHFHPKTEVVLRFFSPAIEVERIGLAAGWRRKPEVLFRMNGAAHPVK
jgi:hypothetical protein